MLKGEEAQNQGLTVLKVEARGMQHIRAQGVYHSDPPVSVCSIRLILIVQFTFSGKVYLLVAGDMLRYKDYMTARNVASALPVFSKVVSNVPRFLFTNWFMGTV